MSKCHRRMNLADDSRSSHDKEPSIFDREYSHSTPTPSPKRQKVDDAPSRTSIAAKAKGNLYTDTSELLLDLDHASSDLLQELEEKANKGDISRDVISKEKELISTLKSRLQSLIVGEAFLRPKSKQGSTEVAKADGRSLSSVPPGLSNTNNKTVLTLCGGDRSAKQLFSSLAKSDKALADMPLPNGITTTSLMPVHDQGEVNNKVPTFGERYKTPSHLKQLSPPKPISRHVATRSMNVGWHDPIEMLTTSKEPSPRDPYFVQNLPTGRSLTYNVAPSTDQMTSPTSKRRFRDRALSTGEPQSAIDAETTIAHEKAKEDALFRSVFSSFAPSRDDQGAVVSELEKNRIWWAKYGEPQLHGHIDTIGDVFEGFEEAMDVVTGEELDEKLIEEGLTNWTTYNEAQTPFDKQAEEGKGADGLLKEISELLEILNSHQRIRHATQPSSTQPLQGSKSQQSDLPSEISMPSDAEYEVYEDLKTQLAEVIASLPPYMLSKIDGDKLRPLQLNTKIQIQGRHQKGTLEDDMTSARPRPGAYGNQAPYAAPVSTRGGYASTPAQPPTHRTSYSSQTPVQRAVPNTSYSRYAGQTPTASQYAPSTARPTYNQYPPQRTPSSYASQYGYQQSSYSQYGNAYRPTGMQQVSNYSPQYSPAHRPPPQGAPAQYSQQRAPVPPNYQYNQAGQGRSPNTHPLANYGGQPAGAPTRPPLPHQYSGSYGGSQSPQHQVNGIGMDSQGRQSPMQRPDSTDVRKQHSLTPQPQIQPAGSPQPQRNGTPGAQPNGVTA